MKLIRTFGREKDETEALIAMLEQRGATNTARVEPLVKKILAGVRTGGDAALMKFAVSFDGLAKGVSLRVTPEEMQDAWEATEPVLQKAMRIAQANIQAFAGAQMPGEWTVSPARGVKTGQIVRPLASVGCYVPGGRYPLPSTLLMTTTPGARGGGGTHYCLFA